MAQEPASYRAGSASFDLNAGSALKAILPGAFQGAVVGSLAVAMYFQITFFAGEGSFALSDLAGALMAFCFTMMVATLAGTIICCIYIALIGFPLALVMHRRIASPVMLWLSVAVATLAGLATAYLSSDSLVISPGDEALIALTALAYAIPAGVFYRRAIITERLLSFWGDRE